MIQLPTEFKEFLRSFNDHDVEYLLIGGYAVGYHGYPRATADIDVWVACKESNADRIVEALKTFGFDVPELTPALFLEEHRIVRMGRAPLRIEIMMSVDGVAFEACYRERIVDTIEGMEISVISLEHLKQNKRASGRLKDLADLDYLD